MNLENKFSNAQIHTARVRTSIGFILYGLIQGLWLVQIPTVVERLNMDAKTLSLVVLCSGIGSAVAQPFAGWFVGVLGSPRATRYFQPAFFFMIPVMILAPTKSGPNRKPNKPAVATEATPTLAATPLTRLAAPTKTG